MNSRWIPFSFLLALATACSLSKGPSSHGLYQFPVEGKQAVKGSNAQAVQTIIVDHTPDDATHAIKKAFAFQALNFEIQDPKTGTMSGSGNWRPPEMSPQAPCIPPFTYAVWVKQLDRKPTVQVTVLIDRHSACGAFADPEKSLLRVVLADFSKILATY